MHRLLTMLQQPLSLNLAHLLEILSFERSRPRTRSTRIVTSQCVGSPTSPQPDEVGTPQRTPALGLLAGRVGFGDTDTENASTTRRLI